ncbi:MAG: GNAT family N-acetyltransferase [Lachnospiraceae bacterium]|nr:GNAT family N-acetyltransferase [Lachnospiraceae bacterium]
MLTTKRMILRPFRMSDAEDIFRWAQDPEVGPPAGWAPHKSIDETRSVIRNILSRQETYALCLKEDGRAIGAAGLHMSGHTDLTDRDDECELGYWLARPFWGQGLVPEAARALLRRCFVDLGMRRVWCGYYDGNEKSRRVQEKVGFVYQWTTENVDVPALHEKRRGHVSCLTREQWLAGQRDVRITAVRKTEYPDLMKRFENPIEHACGVSEGDVFVSKGGQRPEGFCESAWDSVAPFVRELADGGGDFFDGWMKDPHSAMISCNDGFRPVSFLLEAAEQAAETE